MMADDESIPVFTASAPMSPITASIWERTVSTGISTTSTTSRVFWAVTAVMTDVPYTPSAAKVFRSAWMPAPPPESEPAMVMALGTGLPVQDEMVNTYLCFRASSRPASFVMENLPCLTISHSTSSANRDGLSPGRS